MLSWNTKGGQEVRAVTKLAEPKVLQDNREAWTAAYIAEPENNYRKYRYRDQEIKTCLVAETSNKCVYCESKIGHNTPGDVEHKTPSSLDITMHFVWINLTIACTECNRRKNDYFSELKPFLDPYIPNVEQRLVHHGPTVSWVPGDAVAEMTVKILQINDAKRGQLVARKAEHIDAINNAVARLHDGDPLVVELMKMRIADYKSPSSEFSGMAIAICQTYGL